MFLELFLERQNRYDVWVKPSHTSTQDGKVTNKLDKKFKQKGKPDKYGYIHYTLNLHPDEKIELSQELENMTDYNHTDRELNGHIINYSIKKL